MALQQQSFAMLSLCFKSYNLYKYWVTTKSFSQRLKKSQTQLKVWILKSK